jgi:hypothetical protein
MIASGDENVLVLKPLTLSHAGAGIDGAVDGHGRAQGLTTVDCRMLSIAVTSRAARTLAALCFSCALAVHALLAVSTNLSSTCIPSLSSTCIPRPALGLQRCTNKTKEEQHSPKNLLVQPQGQPPDALWGQPCATGALSPQPSPSPQPAQPCASSARCPSPL